MRRFITLITPESEGEKSEEALPVDLRTLRAIRVLRPLKLVSGVPSKFFPSTVPRLYFSLHAGPIVTPYLMYFKKDLIAYLHREII
jgi:hypothetical protein